MNYGLNIDFYFYYKIYIVLIDLVIDIFSFDLKLFYF